MEPLYAILKARHKRKCLGHWVVMRAKIEGVDLFACAYAWSQSSVSYFLSTTGNTRPSKHLYRSQFEDEFGCVAWKDVPRPEFAEFIFIYLPLIDEHNKKRQHLLNLEICWPTRHCWFRLVTTITGDSVVDLHHLYINQNKGKQLHYVECDIRKFSDLVCHPLGTNDRGWYSFLKQRKLDDVPMTHHLERITFNDGTTNRPPTETQRKRNKTVGNAATLNCFVCRRYLKQDETTEYNTTQWRCQYCKMPICGIDRSVHATNEQRTQSCLREHLTQTDISHPLACISSDSFPKSKIFPSTLQVPFSSTFTFATTDNNKKKDNDDEEIHTSSITRSRSSSPHVQRSYNTRHQQKKQPHKKQDKITKKRKLSEIQLLKEYNTRSCTSSTPGRRSSPRNRLKRRARHK